MGFSNNEYLKQLSDAELVAQYKKETDKQLIGELYKRYTHLVMGMCIHYFKDTEVAKDMVLQIFEKLFDELKKHEVINFKNWLTFVVRNYCISELRKIQTRLNRDIQYQYEIKQLAIEINDDKAEHEKQLEQLEKALKELNPFQKKCVELFYLKNRSYTQIVEITGYPLNQVKSYIQNGKRNLKLLITNVK